MKIKPGPRELARLARLREIEDNRPIEVNSSSDDEIESEDDSDLDDVVMESEGENESDHAILISSDDDDVIMVDQNENRSIDNPPPVDNKDDDRPLDDLLGSRQSSTDREVSADEIDLDNVRWASSSDEDEALVQREPNPMIPGKFISTWPKKLILYFVRK